MTALWRLGEGNVRDVMNAHGTITKKETDNFLKTFMQAFERWTSTAQTADEDFDTFLARREQISSEYIQGKAAPLIGISTSGRSANVVPPTAPCGWRSEGHAANAAKASERAVLAGSRCSIDEQWVWLLDRHSACGHGHGG